MAAAQPQARSISQPHPKLGGGGGRAKREANGQRMPAEEDLIHAERPEQNLKKSKQIYLSLLVYRKKEQDTHSVEEQEIIIKGRCK